MEPNNTLNWLDGNKSRGNVKAIQSIKCTEWESCLQRVAPVNEYSRRKLSHAIQEKLDVTFYRTHIKYALLSFLCVLHVFFLYTKARDSITCGLRIAGNQYVSTRKKKWSNKQSNTNGQNHHWLRGYLWKRRKMLSCCRVKGKKFPKCHFHDSCFPVQNKMLQ